MTGSPNWTPGRAPVAVVMISLNEGHNIAAVLDNLKGWAQEVFLVDSYSSDATVDIALARGVHVVQRRFRGFGDQWNYAVTQLPATAPFTMKLDPDERLSDGLKQAIIDACARGGWDGLSIRRRYWFMGKPLSVREWILRVWRTGACKFSDVSVNEHPIVAGKIDRVEAELEHLDSPNLHHWLHKQNRYTTAEAVNFYRQVPLATQPRLFGSRFERRMWLKRIYARAPFRHTIMWAYCLFVLGAWRAGRVGFIWARLRAEVFRMIEYKHLEMRWMGRAIELPPPVVGQPHARAVQAEPER